MKSVITAIGALSLAASAAHAATINADTPARAPAIVATQSHVHVSARDYAREKFDPKEWATNRGAGTSRSNDANDG